MIITIDGIQFDVEDTSLAQAIQKQTVSFDQEKSAFAEKMKKKEEEKDEEKKEKEKAKAQADAMANDQLSDDALETLVNDRATLIVNATKILGDEMLECNCPTEIKSAVISKILPNMSLDGKSKEYIEAAYDMAVLKADKTKESLDKVSSDFVKQAKDIKTITTDREEARKQYAKDQLGMEV